MIQVKENVNTNYPDWKIIHCIHILSYHTVPPKYVQF